MLKRNPEYRVRLLLGGVAALTLGSASLTWAQIQVDVNRRPVQFGNVGPARIGGRVFIPLRAVVEALGADVRWNAATQTVRGSRGGREFSLPIGARTAQVNGRSLALDAPARLIAGNTMVPLRFVAEALGAEVDWNAAQQTVAINLDSGNTGGGSSTGAGRDRNSFGETVSGELMAVQPNNNPPTLTLSSRGLRQTYRITADTQVTRGARGGRGQRVDPSQLRPRDQVVVRLDATGRFAEQVDAIAPVVPRRIPAVTRPTPAVPRIPRVVRGNVISVVRRADPPLLIVTVNRTRQTYDVGAARIYVRNAAVEALVPATLNEIRAGDDVVVRLDRTGQIATRVDATHRAVR